MKKRVLSLLLCALIVVQFLPIGLQSANAVATTAYSMATDTDIQSKTVSTTFSGITWMQQSGSATLTIVDNGGAKAISVTGRTSDWNALDLKNLTTLPDGFDYTVKVTGRAVVGAKMKLAQTGSPYTTHISQVVGSDGAYSLEKNFTYAQLQTEKVIRIQSEGSTGDFTIDSIVITKTPVTTTAYSMATDTDIQSKTVSTTFSGITWMQQAGSPTLTIVDNNGAKAISVTGRTSDWNAVDLKNLTTLPDGFDYTVKVTGRAAVGAKMKLAQTGSPYTTHISQVVGSDGAYSLEKNFTYAQLQTEKVIRIQSEGSTGDFTIDSIVITKTAVSGGTTSPPIADGATTSGIAIHFNNADKTLWSVSGGSTSPAGGTFSVVNTTNVAVEWVSDFGNGDTYALKGTHQSASTDYNAANNAIRLTFAAPLAKNAVYTISYSVYVPTAGNEGKGTLVGPGVVLSGDYSGAAGVTKFPSDPGTITPGAWKVVNVTTPAGGLNETLKSIDFRFVTNDALTHPDVWYIDNITISQQLIDVGNTAPDYKSYTPLKEVYKNYFLIGTTSGNSKMTGDKLDIIKYHFNAFTPENEMKPDSVQHVQGVFTYDTLDQQFGKLTGAGINLIGHTLAWHSQTPAWMWGSPTPLSAADAKANMDTHIANVLGKYGASIYSIDVVNEATLDGKNNADWKQNLRNSEGWYLALGSEWVEDAFVKAAQIVDANGWNCKLYYNDYNLDNADKAKSVYNMVKDINERYAGTRPNGKKLIEGIGMQGHYNQNTSAANVENSIKLFSTLPGVSVSVTELDITYTNSGSLTDTQAKSQAVKYAQLFDVYKKYAAGTANTTGNPKVIERVTFWGTNDADSWRATSFPLLFDNNLRAKEAFKAVLNPTQYLSITEIPQDIPKATSVYGTPTLGANDAVWQKASVINVNKKPTDQTTAAGATAIVKTLWDNSNLYVRAEVADTRLDATSANAWEQDSVEVFLSETAHRDASYSDGDGQYRVTYQGKTSFKSDAMGSGFSSWAATTGAGAGYVVEMKIPFRVIHPKAGTSVSFDVQINDVTNGASTRNLTVWSDLKANGYNSTEQWGTLNLTKAIDGVHVYSTSNGDGYTGANIILGGNAGAWPWSTAGADGKVAFTPEKDATYRITVNETSKGTNAIRIRWLNDDTNLGYTTQDGNVVGASPSLNPSQKATSIPVYFDKGMTTGGIYTLITEVRLDGSQPANGLIGNIAIRGGAGGSDFQINSIKVEKVGTGGASDKLLVNWPEGIVVPGPTNPIASSDPTPTVTSSQSPFFTSSVPTGDVPPANIANKPIKGTVVGTPQQALDNAEKAFKQNPGIVKTSTPITLAAPPKTNTGLTPVSVPLPAGTKFTALVSPNADGSFTPVPAYIDKNGTVYALINETKTLIPVTINTVYSDVKESHWFAKSAKTASELGIIFGNGDSTFRPDEKVTNQQAVSMLLRTVGFNSDYNNVLSTAAAKGIKSAAGLDNKANPSRVLTAVLIKDILTALNVNVSLTENEKTRILAPFKDLKGLTDEETLSIAVAVKYGILAGTQTGKDNSTMSPEVLLTRAQMATIAVRLVNFLTK
jgi:GH35 family endo-1,4-beta-xylanase